MKGPLSRRIAPAAPLMDWSNLEGLIPLFGGVYGLLLARGVVPRSPRDPEKLEQWRARFGRPMTVLCPLVMAFGSPAPGRL